ncbi:MAG: DUF1566 domain-containing protein [Flavobacteriales bacterium]|nr:DUF1566 domain-containing protein [Flavobacteriales bacterium]
MKKALCFLVLAFYAQLSLSQAPEKINYQAVVRDAAGDILSNQLVGLKFTIRQGSIVGITAYSETFQMTTNTFGLVNLQIGTGTTAYDFSLIDWSNGPYFIETAVDITGGTSYAVMGSSELISVPYALHATTADSIIGGDQSACQLEIGDTYQGGIIFYLDASGCHGLICASSDQSTGIQWYNSSFVSAFAFVSSVGGGFGNTRAIVETQGSGTYAASLCENLSLGGYSDWYLPSIYELRLMFENIGGGNVLGLGDIGGFGINQYWSSTEFDVNRAWLKTFQTAGTEFNGFKDGAERVRAIRAF